MNNGDFIDLQIGALLRMRYFSLFQQFEQKIKHNFEDTISNIEGVIKHKLYFFHGYNHVKSLYVDYDKYSLNFQGSSFNEDEKFSTLTILNIIKIDRKENFVSNFRFEIKSLTKRLEVYPFHDSAIKLINMRNLLAHEPNNSKFKENKHIIESLSKENLVNNEMFYWGNYDMSNLSLENQQIFSNLIYLKIILDKIG